VADCIAASIAREQAVERGTHEKQTRVWKRWQEYTKSIRIRDDDYLEFFSREDRHILIGAFALALREARFSKLPHEQLAAGTVRDSIQYFCTTFRENGHPNPTFDKDGKLAFILQREFRSFKNSDPEEKHQKAIPLSVISKVNKRNSSKLERATGQLATLAIFFSMRSYEYLKVQQAKQQRTKIIRRRNIRFFKGNEQLEHDHPDLEFANCVAITFKQQKKDEKMDTVILMASEDILLCPLRVAAAIVQRIKNYPGCSINSPISIILNGGIIEHVTSQHMIDALMDAASAIGEVKLGIKKEDIGTHSMRSGAAMAMYLGECPVFMIMLIGCWYSDTFLCYIRKQVMEFSQNMAKRMLSCQNFRHVPNVHMRVSQDDPRIRNHPNNAETRKKLVATHLIELGCLLSLSSAREQESECL
jgi:hypothetical protein